MKYTMTLEHWTALKAIANGNSKTADIVKVLHPDGATKPEMNRIVSMVSRFSEKKLMTADQGSHRHKINFRLTDEAFFILSEYESAEDKSSFYADRFTDNSPKRKKEPPQFSPSKHITSMFPPRCAA